MKRLRMIFVILLVTCILIITVQLRTSSSRVFYKYRSAYVHQNRLKRKLWHQQIRLEQHINPQVLDAILNTQKEPESE